MSYQENDVILCDLCGKTAVVPVSKRSDRSDNLEGWAKVYTYNTLGIPEHACGADCLQRGRQYMEDNAARIEELLDAEHKQRTQQRVLDDGRYQFSRMMELYLDDRVTVTRSTSITTRMGVFPVDFVMDGGEQRVAIVLAGDDSFRDAYREEWSDAMMVGFGAIDTVFRYLGTNIADEIDSCMNILLRIVPGVFSRRGQQALDVLATEQDIELWNRSSDDYEMKRFGEVRCEVHQRALLRSSHQPFWAKYVAFAESHQSANLNELIVAFRDSLPCEF